MFCSNRGRKRGCGRTTSVLLAAFVERFTVTVVTLWSLFRVEDEYNARVHSTIGMKPIDRFGLDLRRIRFLPPDEVREELFFVEEPRKVRADNTFDLKKSRYEAPRDLRNRKISARFNRSNIGRVVVYFKGERMGEALPVDFLANDRPPKGADT